MGVILKNTAQSINIKERMDFSCALFNKNGELVANAPHIPIHLGAMSDTIKFLIRKHFDTFKKVLDDKGGFILAHWDGTMESEKKIKELTKATIRCILNNQDLSNINCIYSGKQAKFKVIYAKAY